MAGGHTQECFAARTLPWLREHCQSDDHYADITYRNAMRLLGFEE